MSESFKALIDGAKPAGLWNQQEGEIKVLRDRIARLERYIQELEYDLLVAKNTNTLNKGQFLHLTSLAELVAAKTGTPVNEMKSDRKDRDVVLSRYILIHLACIFTKLSTVKIGKFLNRDHTTIMHGRDRIRTKLMWDQRLKVLVDDLTQEVERELNRENPELARSAGFEPAP